MQAQLIHDRPALRRIELQVRLAKVLLNEPRDALPEGAFSLRAIDRVAVKGKRRAQLIYEVLDAAPEADRAERERARPAFEAALARFHAREFEAARRGFEACRAAAPNDPVPAIYVERCLRFEAEPPPPDWEGVERLA